jgi:hypothetical protein
LLDQKTWPVSIVRASEVPGQKNLVTTGIEELDGLVGGLEGGRAYLFYGDGEFVDDLVHRMIVRGAVAGSVAYMNNTDYHTSKTLLDLNTLAGYAKREGLEPLYLMRRVFFVAAYNELRQPKAARALAERMEQSGDVSLLIVHSVTKFLADAKDMRATTEDMDVALSELWHRAVQKSAAMVVTAEASEAPRGRVPMPVGSGLLNQMVNVAVFFRRVQKGVVQAVLVKHPEVGVPKSITISEAGEPLMGRMTPSFRQVYQMVLERLRKQYVPLLRDRGRREAFEILLKEAWDAEHAAMANSQLPLVLDAMNLTANVHNTAELTQVRKEMDSLRQRLDDLERKLVSGGAEQV